MLTQDIVQATMEIGKWYKPYEISQMIFPHLPDVKVIGTKCVEHSNVQRKLCLLAHHKIVDKRYLINYINVEYRRLK